MNHRILDACCCPLTLERMEDPVISPYGHSYERAAITKVLRRDPRCPTTRKELHIMDLCPNRALKEIIEVLNNEPERAKKRAREEIQVYQEPLPATPRPMSTPTASGQSSKRPNAQAGYYPNNQECHFTMLCPAETNWILRDGPITGWDYDTCIRIDGHGSNVVTDLC
jgi:hypothetical protein